MPNDRAAFRLRFRDGRFAAAPFPPSLRLRFTFPFTALARPWHPTPQLRKTIQRHMTSEDILQPGFRLVYGYEEMKGLNCPGKASATLWVNFSKVDLLAGEEP